MNNFEKNLRKMIFEEAYKMLSVGNPHVLKMNNLDKEDNSEGDAYVMSKSKGGFETKRGKITSDDTTKLKMNKHDSDLGSDEDAATAVMVNAKNSTKKGGVFTGMHNAEFDSKTEGPEVKTSQPFVDEFGYEMNSQDEEDKSIPKGGAKTFPETGAELKKGVHVGQKKSVFSTKSKNEKDREPIAKGIQIPESFTRKSLEEFILNEAKYKVKNIYFFIKPKMKVLGFVFLFVIFKHGK